MTGGGRWLRLTTSWTVSSRGGATSRPRRRAGARGSQAAPLGHGGSGRSRARATVRRRGRDGLAGPTVRVATASTGVSTASGRRGHARGAGQAAKLRARRDGFAPRTGRGPSTAAHDGSCGQQPTRVKRGGSEARGGPQGPARSGRPQGEGGPGQGSRAPEERLCLNNLTKPAALCYACLQASASSMACWAALPRGCTCSRVLPAWAKRRWCCRSLQRQRRTPRWSS